MKAMGWEMTAARSVVQSLFAEAGEKATSPGTKSAKKRAPAVKVPAKPVKDGQQYIKTELLRELGPITRGMIKKSKAGGTAPLKLLWELGKLHEDSKARRKTPPPSLGKLLLDELRKKKAQKKLLDETEQRADAGKQS